LKKEGELKPVFKLKNLPLSRRYSLLSEWMENEHPDKIPITEIMTKHDAEKEHNKLFSSKNYIRIFRKYNKVFLFIKYRPQSVWVTTEEFLG
jgi:hypothetical protein